MKFEQCASPAKSANSCLLSLQRWDMRVYHSFLWLQGRRKGTYVRVRVRVPCAWVFKTVWWLHKDPPPPSHDPRRWIFYTCKKMPPLDRRNKMNLTICSYPSHCSNSKVPHTQKKGPNVGFVVLIRKRKPRLLSSEFRLACQVFHLFHSLSNSFVLQPQKLWPDVCSVDPPTLGGRIHLQLGATTN
jgi:hypothetical protein